MSRETLVQQTTNSPESGSSTSSSFNADSFDQSVMSTYGRFPLALERGQGCRVWDTQGKEYLDFVAGNSLLVPWDMPIL